MLSSSWWFSPVDLLTSSVPCAHCHLTSSCLSATVCLSWYWPLFFLYSSSLQHPQMHRICALMGYSSLLILPKLHVKYISSIIRLLELLFIYYFFLKTCLNCSPGCVWIRRKQSAWASLPNSGIRWVRYHIQSKPFPFSCKMLAVSQMAANMVFFSLLQHVQ